MTRWRSASLPATSILTTTRSPASARRFLKQIEGLFVEVLKLAREMGVLKLGTVALDGTKIHANASRHSALSYEHAGKIEAQLKAEVADLLAKAEAADQADVPDGMSIPEELARREARLAKLAEARAKIEARAKERFERERAEYEAKLAAREAKAEATGRKPSGRPPQPPVEGPLPTDQINLTDEASRIMPVAGGGFEQCYNAQAAVAADSLLVVADRCGAGGERQAADRADGGKAEGVAEELGKAETLLADNGYFSAGNVTACETAEIAPLIATGPGRASSVIGRAFRRCTCRTAGPHAGSGHGAPAEDAGRQAALRVAQAGAGTGVRHHQIGAGLPAVSAARAGPRPRRVEPCDHGVEPEADVRPLPLGAAAAKSSCHWLNRCWRLACRLGRRDRMVFSGWGFLEQPLRRRAIRMQPRG